MPTVSAGRALACSSARALRRSTLVVLCRPGAWRAMRNLGVRASGSGLLLGVLNGLAIAEPNAFDELAEAVGAVEPAPVALH